MKTEQVILASLLVGACVTAMFILAFKGLKIIKDDIDECSKRKAKKEEKQAMQQQSVNWKKRQFKMLNSWWKND